jgi:hypothetical protein
MSTGISILSATYGAGSSTVDVTKTVSAHIHEGTLNMLVSVDSLNVTDPSPGNPKVLNITYTVNGGGSNSLSVKDGNTAFIAAPAARSASGLLITKAEYGYEGNYTDVTDAIQDQVSNGSINISISSKTAGIPDPNPSKQKSLKVTYTLNGAPNTETIPDGKKFSVSAPPSQSVDNKTPKQYGVTLLGSITSALGYFLMIFAVVLSVFASSRMGPYVIGSSMFGGALGLFLPVVTPLFILPSLAFGFRLFSSVDFIPATIKNSVNIAGI